MPAPTLDDLRRYAVARTLFKPTTLPRAIQRLGFVQADPIRAPADNPFADMKDDLPWEVK